MERKNLILIVVTLILISIGIVTIILYFPKDGPEPPTRDEDKYFFLDYDYIWNLTKNFSEVIYKYPPDLIPKGRAYGSWGGNYTVDILIDEMLNDTGLDDVQTEQIKHIPGINKSYTSIIDVNDFQLVVNNDNYPLPNPIPIKESFVIPSGYPDQPLDKGGNLTHKYDLTNAKIRPTLYTSLFPLGGTYSKFSFIINNFTWLNMKTPFLVGNVTYLEDSDMVPNSDEQDGRVFMFNDTQECSDKLDNLTNAEGCILIDQGIIDISNTTALKSSCPVVRIRKSDGDTVKDLIEKYSTVLVDNMTGNLTFTYNLCEGDYPSSDFVILMRIPLHNELFSSGWLTRVALRTKGAWWINTVRRACNLSVCKGFVLYDMYENHFMISPNYYWDNTTEPKTSLKFALPIFTLNYTVGSFLNDNHRSTTLTGFCDQELFKETENSTGVEAYNVIGNISINNSPNDAIAVLSNRYDGWWGQTPGDSGIGGAIVLGIAKYMKDHNITPKYNLSFVFTTGEEYGKRGAHHYNDCHNETEYNIIFWLGLDQLGYNQQDVPMCLYSKNETHTEIVKAITDQTCYITRTGYKIKNETGNASGSEQEIFSKRTNCDTIWMLRADSWDRWHRTGLNYTEGDSLKYTDQNDVNVTAELVWNITKYFCVNPDCWFEKCNFTAFDSPDEDNLNDSINATFTIKTHLPHDFVMVNAFLNRTKKIVANKQVDYAVTPDGINGTITLTVPEREKAGWYTCTLYLYNSTGSINEIIEFYIGDNRYNDTNQSSEYYLHPFKYKVCPLIEIIVGLVAAILVLYCYKKYYYKKKKSARK